MATIDVIMPQMGESIAEGTLSRWIKKVGEAVKRDEPIFEISTDKVDAEIPAPSAGVLTEILVQEGQTVPVQTVVAKIDTEAAAGAEKPVASAPAPAAAAPAAPAPPAPAPKPVAAAPAPAPATRPAAEKPRTGHLAEGNGEMETAEERLRRRSTPLVRKMVAEHNLDLSEIPGTGLAGRVTKNDVLGYIETGAGERGAELDVPTASGAPMPQPAAAPPARGPAAPQPALVPAGVEPWEGDRVEPWSRIRKLTAEHMVMSRRVSPHVNTIFEIDYTRISQLRAKKKKEYADRGVNLTFLAFIAKAAADSLRKHPALNAAVSGESTILRRDINLGIAVALDWGLIVPVVKHADELALLGLARAINDLGERARAKKLSPDEVQKGTFTITNPGVFGSVIGTPIINQPQAAILCVGSIEKQPAVITVDGSDTIGVRTKGMLSLAFDHRIVDGADADRFMADVKQTLQEFSEAAV
ncbi:MAG TPA: dihydrolipoamide acetyltransferase family protein [Gemmatimonadales bacterium]|nr:dihydrolipoamide acetyltransferase family protein [Gemmatimonadales bacterium]